MELSARVLEHLRKAGPSKARSIARMLEVERKQVNQTLYYQLKPEGKVKKNENHTWEVC